MASTISYNSYNLQTSNVITESIFHTGTPEKDLSLYRNARRNGSVITSNYWTMKTITVSGTLISSSIANLDALIDTFKQQLTAGENLNLDIGYAGGTRRYKATTKSIILDRERFNTYWIPFVVEFECPDPFGRSTSLITENITGKTSSVASLSFTLGGSVPTLPSIDYTVNSMTSISKVVITNTTTSESMTITRAFSALEVLTIDCENMTVKVDGTEVDYSGVFPSFVVGANTITSTTTGSSFNIDLEVNYYNFYL